jgi:hypothetical protein
MHVDMDVTVRFRQVPKIMTDSTANEFHCPVGMYFTALQVDTDASVR